MTSPTEPPRESVVSRISTRFSSGGPSHPVDPEERFTRNVTWAFVGLIGLIAVVVVAGLAYGIWDSNFRPIGNVGGAEVSRSQWDQRLDLVTFRLQRAEAQVRVALSSGAIDSDLANRRLSATAAERDALGVGTIDEFIDLIYQGQLAQDEGIALSQEELDAALAASGTAPEFRHVNAVIILPEGVEIGLDPTPEGRQEALVKAEAAAAALEAGTPFEDVVNEYSSLTGDDASGDLGFLQRSDIADPAWAEAIFSLEEGGVTDLITGLDGEYLIGTVVGVVPEQPDRGFLDAVALEVGEEINEDNVEMEAIAAKLEAQIIAAATATDAEQVQLAEIFVEGNTFVDPEEDEGAIRASHILYAPGDLTTGEALAEDDPAWDEKRLLAEAAAEELRAIEDPEERAAAFIEKAATDSDGPTSATGGDLGYFERFAMVPEFADPLFEDSELQPGDIIGPVRSDFGWHVIEFVDRRAPITERVEAVEAALAAPGADFATVAREYSDGAEAANGGDTGWHVSDDLDDLTLAELSQIAVGEFTPRVDGDAGYYFYLKQDEGERALDPVQAAFVADTAFADWYEDRRFEAEDSGVIDFDVAALLPEPEPVPLHQQVP